MATVVGVAWYDPSEWQQLRALVPDADRLEATHAEWLACAEQSLRDLRATGHDPYRVPVKVGELQAWCEASGTIPDATARAAYASAELQRLHKAGHLNPAPNER